MIIFVRMKGLYVHRVYIVTVCMSFQQFTEPIPVPKYKHKYKTKSKIETLRFSFVLSLI